MTSHQHGKAGERVRTDVRRFAVLEDAAMLLRGPGDVGQASLHHPAARRGLA